MITQKQIKELKKIAKYLKQDVLTYDYNIKTPVYDSFHYSDSTDKEHNKYKTFIKSLSSNATKKDKSILIDENLRKYVLDKYNLSIMTIWDINNNSYLNWLLSEYDKDSYIKDKIDNVFNEYRRFVLDLK